MEETLYTLTNKRIAQSIEENLGCDDIGNSKRIVLYFGNEIRYNYTNRYWLIWNGKYWKKDSAGDICELSKRLPQFISDEARLIDPDSERYKKYLRWAAETASEYRLKCAINLAKSDPLIKRSQNEFDKDKYKINFLNGTYDLKEMKFTKHDPNDLLSKIAPVEYDINANCPKWKSFLDKIFNQNQNLIDFLSRVIAYSLTGSVGERCFFVFWGGGFNGKSTFLDVILQLLGDYGTSTPFETFLQKKYDTISNDLAALNSVRFVSASEPQSRRRLSEAIIKQVTGGDPVKARFLRQEFFEFYPEFKIFLNTNHKPIIYEQTEAIWQRVRLIPFTVTIAKEERIPDYHLQIINEELSGVLNWALKGLSDYWEAGLRTPEEVTLETNKYRREEDLVGQFMNTCCNIQEGESIKGKAFYDAFRNWCEQSGEEPISNRLFGSTLRERGFANVHRKDGKHWLDIILTDDW